jgi:uncharacterized protein
VAVRNPISRVSRRGRVTIAVLAVVFLLFTLFDRVIGVWTDWLWFKELNYTQVFTGVLRTRLVMFLVVGIGVAVIVAVNLYLAYRMRPLLRPHSAEQNALDRYRQFLAPHMGAWIWLLAGLIGLFAGLSAQGHWQEWMLFANSTPFGQKDPQFGVDISFYVFKYPFWRYLLGVGFTTVVFSLLGALGLHYLFGGVRLQGAGERMTTAARAHLAAIVAAFVLLKAVAYFLDRRGLLLDKYSGIDLYGGGYTNINALLPAKEILAWISVVVAIAILVFSNAFMRNLVWPGLALALLALSAVAVGGIYPAAVQSFTVKPSLLSKESTYIERSIKATRDAYGLNVVKTSSYPGDAQAPPTDLSSPTGSAAGTVNNVRLLDPSAVGETYTQLQQVRGFYEFNNKLDIDRYTINNQTQDYVVGVREIRYDQLTAAQSNWQNKHTVYTHGYGFVAAPANKVVCNGQPYFVSGFLSDQTKPQPTGNGEQCASPTDEIPVDQPRIYYGEQMGAAYAVVGSPNSSTNAEFDRPTGNADQYFTYNGSGGVAVGSFWRRLLYAAYFRETNFLLSSVFNSNSKLLYVRDPESRVQKVAPFLTLDNDAYPAVVDGKILWIIDGYTTASTYPYSQKIDWRTAITDASTTDPTFPQVHQDVNYLRNSVKATVDAYTGEVKLYAFDDTDPVLRTWNKAFGGKLIQPASAMSPQLVNHLRYPEDQFKVQRDLLSRFHVTTPNGFFSGQDFWQVPKDPGDDTLDQPPYYLVAQFPGESAAQFQLTAAVVPRNRGNLAALMSANYVNGKPQFNILELPADTNVPGPEQVHGSMTSIPEARQELTQFTSQKSDVIYGNLLSLPVSDGMLYVEPLYLKTKGDNSYPFMRKVLVAYQKYVAYADNLTAGLESLVQQATGQTSTPSTGSPPPAANNPPAGGTPNSNALSSSVAAMDKALADLKNAQISGDPEAYGAALKELTNAINQYNAAKAAGSSVTSSASPSAPPSGSPSATASPAG